MATDYGKIALVGVGVDTAWLAYITFQQVKGFSAINKRLDILSQNVLVLKNHMDAMSDKLAVADHLRDEMGRLQDDVQDIQDHLSEFDSERVVRQLQLIIEGTSKQGITIEKARSSKKGGRHQSSSRKKSSSSRRRRRATVSDSESEDSPSSSEDSSSSDEADRNHRHRRSSGRRLAAKGSKRSMAAAASRRGEETDDVGGDISAVRAAMRHHR